MSVIIVHFWILYFFKKSYVKKKICTQEIIHVIGIFIMDAKLWISNKRIYHVWSECYNLSRLSFSNIISCSDLIKSHPLIRPVDCYIAMCSDLSEKIGDMIRLLHESAFVHLDGKLSTLKKNLLLTYQTLYN